MINMKTKLEARLDREFERRYMRPWVYYVFDMPMFVPMFKCVTIVTQTRQDARKLDKDVWKIAMRCDGEDRPAKKLRAHLAKSGFYGIAICDIRDVFSRKRGRVIAKGRLLKHIQYEDFKTIATNLGIASKRI